ncbi:unnamed protein product, partial [Phaeothamnion confervicola]
MTHESSRRRFDGRSPPAWREIRSAQSLYGASHSPSVLEWFEAEKEDADWRSVRSPYAYAQRSHYQEGSKQWSAAAYNQFSCVSSAHIASHLSRSPASPQLPPMRAPLHGAGAGAARERHAFSAGHGATNACERDLCAARIAVRRQERAAKFRMVRYVELHMANLPADFLRSVGMVNAAALPLLLAMCTALGRNHAAAESAAIRRWGTAVRMGKESAFLAEAEHVGRRRGVRQLVAVLERCRKRRFRRRLHHWHRLAALPRLVARRNAAARVIQAVARSYLRRCHRRGEADSEHEACAAGARSQSLTTRRHRRHKKKGGNAAATIRQVLRFEAAGRAAA